MPVHSLVLRIALACWLLSFVSVAGAVEPDQRPPTAHYHHTRINTTDPGESIQFYETIFNATKIAYRGKSDAILVDRAFILFNHVETQPPWELGSGLYHIGWGAKDTDSEYAWLKKHDVQIETPSTTFGTQKYLYAFGPSHELFEFYSGIPQPRFAHVHLITADVPSTTQWYMDNLGLNGPAKVPTKPAAPSADFKIDPENPIAAMRYLWATEVRTANDIRINIFQRPGHGNFNWWLHSETPPNELVPSKGRALNHIAFSFVDIEPIRDRMKRNGVEILDDIQMRPGYGFKSFFVMGPDNVTIEIVEEKSIPEGIWE